MMLAGMRVLVVEDEALIIMLMEQYLQDLGCAVVGTATCLRDALEKSRSLAMDVALLDVNLAGHMSFPVAEILQTRDIPFVFATGYGTIGLPDNIRAPLMLAKPFQEAQLAHALRKATD
jgi:CheY-like chemotaxis protein